MWKQNGVRAFWSYLRFSTFSNKPLTKIDHIGYLEKYVEWGTPETQFAHRMGGEHGGMMEWRRKALVRISMSTLPL